MRVGEVEERCGSRGQGANLCEHGHGEDFYARLDSMGICINHLRVYLSSVGCLLPNTAGSNNYAALLSSWSEWESLSADEQAERGVPTLEMLLRGAQTVRLLRQWVCADPHAKLPSPLSVLVENVLDADLSYRFARLIIANIATALHEVRAMSLMDKFALRETTTIHRCAKRRPLGLLRRHAGIVQRGGRFFGRPQPWGIGVTRLLRDEVHLLDLGQGIQRCGRGKRFPWHSMAPHSGFGDGEAVLADVFEHESPRR